MQSLRSLIYLRVFMATTDCSGKEHFMNFLATLLNYGKMDKLDIAYLSFRGRPFVKMEAGKMLYLSSIHFPFSGNNLNTFSLSRMLLQGWVFVTTWSVGRAMVTNNKYEMIAKYFPNWQF